MCKNLFGNIIDEKCAKVFFLNIILSQKVNLK